MDSKIENTATYGASMNVTDDRIELTSATLISLTVVICLLLVLGVIGNSLALATVLPNRRLRTTTNLFLISLCFSDLISALVCSPLWLYRRAWGFEEWIWPSFLCQFYWFVDFGTDYVTSLHILSFALIRFVAVKYPLQVNRIRRKTVKMYIGFLWVFSFTMATPMFICMDSNADEIKWPSCSIKHEERYETYIKVVYPICFCFPELVVLILSFIIVRELHIRARWRRKAKNLCRAQNKVYLASATTSPCRNTTIVNMQPVDDGKEQQGDISLEENNLPNITEVDNNTDIQDLNLDKERVDIVEMSGQTEDEKNISSILKIPEKSFIRIFKYVLRQNTVKKPHKKQFDKTANRNGNSPKLCRKFQENNLKNDQNISKIKRIHKSCPLSQYIKKNNELKTKQKEILETLPKTATYTTSFCSSKSLRTNSENCGAKCNDKVQHDSIALSSSNVKECTPIKKVSKNGNHDLTQDGPQKPEKFLKNRPYSFHESKTKTAKPTSIKHTSKTENLSNGVLCNRTKSDVIENSMAKDTSVVISNKDTIVCSVNENISLPKSIYSNDSNHLENIQTLTSSDCTDIVTPPSIRANFNQNTNHSYILPSTGCRHKYIKNVCIQLSFINTCFLLGYIPTTAYMVWTTQQTCTKDCYTDYWFGVCSYLCLRVSECSNPVMYFLGSSAMRKEAKILIVRIKKKLCGKL